MNHLDRLPNYDIASTVNLASKIHQIALIWYILCGDVQLDSVELLGTQLMNIRQSLYIIETISTHTIHTLYGGTHTFRFIEVLPLH